jgi:Transposase DDE domain
MFFRTDASMLIKTKPSTAKCNDEMYMSYLLSEPQYTSCIRLSTIMQTISHDSINRFLERERFEPKDLFDEEKNKIELVGGVLSVDDSILDKPYSDPSKAAFIDYFWSGKHHGIVKGINIISLFYTDIHGISVPINYRIYNKAVNKTKNDYFREMLVEVMSWGVLPAWVTGDSWYSSLENLKFIRSKKLNFMFGIESNRIVSSDRGKYIQIQKFEGWSSENINTVYLKDYGMVKACRQLYKNVYRYYVMSTAELSNLESITKIDFDRLHDAHWSIERFHRAIKQVCNIERFQVRNENPIKNHIFCALKAFVKLELMRFNQTISHWYEIKRDLYLDVIRHFIMGAAKLNGVVNA